MNAQVSSIRAFWDDRARKFGATPRATLNEFPLRQLEILTMQRQIARRRPNRVLDIGCGNGFSTRSFATRFPDIEFIGVDYSAEMIRHARGDVPPNCRFEVGDILDRASLPEGRFDLILTQRCLQNLPEDALQKNAIETLRSLCTGDGAILLMECSKNGVRTLNRFRRRFGRTYIENIEPWHNRFMMDGRMRRRYGARIEHFSSTYMFMVKVLHPRLARLASRLPSFGSFGYNKLYVIE